jgi:3-oxoacid CoA-transferase subunit A
MVSNNCGVGDCGSSILLNAGPIRKMTSSYGGENKEFERQFFAGEPGIQLTPPLVERAQGASVGDVIAKAGATLSVSLGTDTHKAVFPLGHRDIVSTGRTWA